MLGVFNATSSATYNKVDSDLFVEKRDTICALTYMQNMWLPTTCIVVVCH